MTQDYVRLETLSAAAQQVVAVLNSPEAFRGINVIPRNRFIDEIARCLDECEPSLAGQIGECWDNATSIGDAARRIDLLTANMLEICDAVEAA